MLTVAYGEATLDRSKVYRGYKMFLEGREDVNDEERAGRLSTSTTDEKIDEVEKMILANRRITTGRREIRTKIAQLRPKTASHEMLDSVRDDPNLLQRVITGDEAWVYGYDVETKAQSSQWKLPHELRPKKARQIRSNVKALLRVFFDCRGVVHHEFLPQGRTVNKEYYLQVMRNLREAIRQKRPDLWKNKNWLLHHDNAPAHTSLLVRDFLAKNNTLMNTQPPYSPDLAPCDLFLFPKLKKPMKGRRYATLDEIKTASKEELKKILKNDFLKCFEDWKNRWHKCIISHGDYFEGDKIGCMLQQSVGCQNWSSVTGDSCLPCHNTLTYSAPRPPPLEGDMDLAELRKYDGKGPDGRICLAVNGKIFDVTRGKDFYGPDLKLRNIIDKLAQFVARNGTDFEQMTMTKQNGNPNFAFLFGGEHHSYYRHKVASEQAYDFLHYATNPESELEDTDSDCTIVYDYEESSGEDEEVPPPLKTPRSDYIWSDNSNYDPIIFHLTDQIVDYSQKKTENKCQDLGKKLKIGETEAKHTQNLLALKYKDKREVFMLSTMHKNEFANTNKRDKVTNLPIQKPSAVIDYNQKMGTVDQTDMLLSSIGCLRKSLKWYKKLFFHFIDTSLLNAYSSYLVNTGKRPSLAEFHINLIGQIIEKYHEARVQVHRGRPSTSEDRPLRLIERHFPSLVPPTEKKKNPTRYCRVCGANKKRKESRYMCKDCDVALCVVPCFETFHTIKNF
ncbi:hypothetical protein LAZ67_5003213 [Cordylochernes scorpioides]|uniref:SURP motif domain-containing protein n=1 Tax=Cordylochernes scorpioides TaxID=51811 RepID=A0ABY6KI58_9ARAC|nr:hypothetical protein LAZ67_5003213 [Cordylochernes scorpioides]